MSQGEKNKSIKYQNLHFKIKNVTKKPLNFAGFDLQFLREKKSALCLKIKERFTQLYKKVKEILAANVSICSGNFKSTDSKISFAKLDLIFEKMGTSRIQILSQ